MEISLLLYKNSSTKNGFPLKLYVYENRKSRHYIPTGYYSFENDWDFNKGLPKNSHPNYRGILNYVYSKNLEINNLNSRIINENLSFNSIINLLTTDKNLNSFTDFWEDLYKEYDRRKLGKSVFYKETLSSFRLFQKDVQFDEINYLFLTKFKEFKYSKGCSSGGINTYLTAIRAVRNEAINREVFVPKSAKNPFSGMMEKKVKTKDKYFTIDEMRKIIPLLPVENKFNKRAIPYENYFLLCFYLGGIDFIDLANLRYDEHVKNGRIRFTRFKGGTNEFINNKIIPEAQAILDKYNCKPFLVDVHKYQYNSMRANFGKRFGKWLESIGITSYFGTKTPRYTFIDLGKQLQLNRDVVKEIVGHASKDVHSIYEGIFSEPVKDEVHEKIVRAVLA
jgi:integrase